MSKTKTALFGAATAAMVSAKGAPNRAAVDQAFEALTAYDYGSGRGALMPIDQAVRDCLGDDAARREMERRLVAVLKAKASVVAKEYACSKLGLIGSAASVPALAGLLADQALANAARSALEAMPCPEALKAFRDRVPKLGGRQRTGVINSLAMRRDAHSATMFAWLLDSDNATTRAMAAALGNLGTVKAARALLRFQPKAPEALRLAVADACLACAEKLLADGKKADALAVYEALADSQQPKQVRQAAKRGLSLAVRKD